MGSISQAVQPLFAAVQDRPEFESAERWFKTGLRWVSAMNQSRARVLLDPIYEAAAEKMVAEVPLSPQLQSRTFDENLFFSYRETARRLQYSFEDFDWSQARPDLLTARQRAFLHGSTIGETSGFAVGAGFLHAFRNDPELGSFFGIWFTEELNHYWGYHRYMELLGEGYSRARREEVTGVDFRAYCEDPMEMAAANMYQELVAYLIYRSFARQVRDPFLAKMVDAFAKDELRHYKFYQSVVARQIQREPAFRKLVLKHFFKATTPMNQVSGGASKTIGYLSNAAFYMRGTEFDFLLKQTEFLFGTSFEELLAFFYRRHLPPCETCKAEVFRCTCETYD